MFCPSLKGPIYLRCKELCDTRARHGTCNVPVFSKIIRDREPSENIPWFFVRENEACWFIFLGLCEGSTFTGRLCLVDRVSGNTKSYSTGRCWQTGRSREQTTLLLIAGQQLLRQTCSTHPWARILTPIILTLLTRQSLTFPHWWVSSCARLWMCP